MTFLWSVSHSLILSCFVFKDEVLAVSEKIILKLEDLVSLIKDGVSWETGSVPFQDTTADSDNDKQPVNLAKSFAANNFGLKFKGHSENDEVGMYSYMYLHLCVNL